MRIAAQRGWAARVGCVLMLLSALFFLSGCDRLSSLLATALPHAGTGVQTSPGDALQTATSAPNSLSPTATALMPFLQTAAPPSTLTVWLPPQFDPAQQTPAGQILRSRLASFEKEHAVQVQVRVKSEQGAGGLIDSLSAANAAAPLALPSVIALSRPDLESAALKGLIQPLDGLSHAIDEPDWYAYARDLALVQGASYGLPFAGDALILTYHPSKVTSAPADWETLFSLGQPVGFAAGDSRALFPLALYISLNGQVADAQRRPTLQPDVLTKVLQVFADGEQRGLFPYWLSQYETYDQLNQDFVSGKVNLQVSWASSYLAGALTDTTVMTLPVLGDGPSTLARGWSWAVADPIPERRALAAALADYLSSGDFLAQWTQASGYLPARPSAMAAWNNASLKALFSPIVASARAQPSGDLTSILGPVLKDATLNVLKRDSDPVKAAQTAADRLKK